MTALNEKTPLENVTCARIPGESLAALAGLRRVEGISVLASDDHRFWVFWRKGDERTLRTLLPVQGVEVFERRGSHWHVLGRRLPCFEVPDPEPAIALDRVVFPAPFPVIEPGESSPKPSIIRLVREGRQRPSTAAYCPLVELGRWAHSAPSREIESVRGAIRGRFALILGRDLPPWPGSIRYWGDRVLVPIGFQLRPNLAEPAILDALGSSGFEVFRFVLGDDDPSDDSTVEAIPFDVFRPLSRAGIRIALRDRSS